MCIHIYIYIYIYIRSERPLCEPGEGTSGDGHGGATRT